MDMEPLTLVTMVQIIGCCGWISLYILFLDTVLSGYINGSPAGFIRMILGLFSDIYGDLKQNIEMRRSHRCCRPWRNCVINIGTEQRRFDHGWLRCTMNYTQPQTPLDWMLRQDFGKYVAEASHGPPNYNSTGIPSNFGVGRLNTSWV